MSWLAFLSACLAGTLCTVGVGVGAFYRIKFGESTRGWFLACGAVVGILGFALRLLLPAAPLAGDLVALVGAGLLGTGTFWLWFVMMGPRR